MIITCPSCHQQVEDTGRFCDNCGAPLTPGGAPPAAAPPVSGAAAPGTCSACGFANVPGELYCANCGVQLGPVAVSPPPPPVQVPAGPQVVAPPPPPPPSIYTPPAPVTSFVTGRLVVQATNATIQLPQGKSEIVIGREDPVGGIFPEVDLTPHVDENTGVSRRHARIVADGGQIYVEDLGSTNFTILNKARLQPGQRYPLKDGDEIRFGRLIVSFYTG